MGRQGALWARRACLSGNQPESDPGQSGVGEHKEEINTMSVLPKSSDTVHTGEKLYPFSIFKSVVWGITDSRIFKHLICDRQKCSMGRIWCHLLLIKELLIEKLAHHIFSLIGLVVSPSLQVSSGHCVISIFTIISSTITASIMKFGYSLGSTYTCLGTPTCVWGGDR